jgi:lipid-A-disaccharide synthase
VASGTATLETAIMGVPMLIAYKVSPLSFWIGKKIVNVNKIGLVNLVAGEEVAPELIQNDVTAQTLADKALSILENEDLKTNMVKKLNMVKVRLGDPGAAIRTAGIAMEMMEGK